MADTRQTQTYGGNNPMHRQAAAWDGHRSVRFAEDDIGLATTAYSYKLSYEELTEAAERIALLWNLHLDVSTEELRRRSPSPQPNVAADPALIGIAEEMKESGGHWQPCTGCYDTEDGHPTRKYDYSPTLQTEIGCGCHECGGLGAVWWHMTEAEIASYVEDMNAIDDDAIDAIQRLMEKKGLKRKDLFPAKSRASEYMSRKRPLSIATIRKLHFEHGIPAEVLIAPYRMATTEDQDNG